MLRPSPGSRRPRSKPLEEEVDAALAEVKAQEDARHNKTEDLKRKSTQGGEAL